MRNRREYKEDAPAGNISDEVPRQRVPLRGAVRSSKGARGSEHRQIGGGGSRHMKFEGKFGSSRYWTGSSPVQENATTGSPSGKHAEPPGADLQPADYSHNSHTAAERVC